jgi:hypothetical protein
MRFSSTASVFALGALSLSAFAVPLPQGDGYQASGGALPRGITTSKIDIIPNDKRGVTTSKIDIIPNDKRGVTTSKIDIIPNDKRGVTTSKIGIIPIDTRGVTTSKIQVVPIDTRGVTNSRIEVVPNDTRDAAINKPARAHLHSGRTSSSTITQALK